MRSIPVRLLASLVLLLAACSELEDQAERLFDRRTPRERYVAALAAAGLTNHAIATDWIAAAERALSQPVRVTTPHVEEGYLVPTSTTALGWTITVRRGQELTFALTLADSTTLVFLEAFEMPEDSLAPPRRLAVADSGERSLQIEPRRDGDILLRAQPELLRGGRFTASLHIAPTLAFPVSGRSDTDIGSPFGAPRDGGVRSHHGVDIFAPRGTPVLATSPGFVRRVAETPRGGKVVWLADRRGNAIYYAHLDGHAVTGGEQVEVGDTLGFVGNTGNARTTPPHLHFGVYRRGEGPVDPRWFLWRPRGQVPRLTADTLGLGAWRRAAIADLVLREGPDRDAATRATLPQDTPLRIVAAHGAWYRVEAPDGTPGFVEARYAESLEVPLEEIGLGRPAALSAHWNSVLAPTPDHIVDELPPSATVTLLGRFGSALLVRASEGQLGWLSDTALRAAVGD